METTVEKKKWISQAGPRQTKKVNGAIRDLLWQKTTFEELSGVHGKPETERRSTLTSCFGSVEGGVNHKVEELYSKVGDRFEWKITRANYQDVIAALQEATQEAIQNRPVVDRRITQEEKKKRDEACDKHYEKQEQQRQKSQKSVQAILAKKPVGASALIVAEYEEDNCDLMTDYFNVKTTRYVAIGWRYGRREDFKQLRQAALGFEETKHLGPDAPKSIEHRDNHSMGAGNYLKEGSRYSTGWAIRSEVVGSVGRYMSVVYEDHLPEPKESGQVQSSNGEISITKNIEKNGVEIRFPEKPASEVLSKLKANRWRWSRFARCWYHRDTPEAVQFAESL